MGTKPARGDGVPRGQQRETVWCCSHHVALTFVARTVRMNMRVQKLVNILKIQLYLPFGHNQLLLRSCAHPGGQALESSVLSVIVPDSLWGHGTFSAKARGRAGSVVGRLDSDPGTSGTFLLSLYH